MDSFDTLGCDEVKYQVGAREVDLQSSAPDNPILS